MFAGAGIDPARQLVVELPDHCDLPGPQGAVVLGGGGGRQQRRQRFAGQSVAGSQVGGLVDAPGGFGAADQCRLGDRVGEFAAELFGGGLAGNRIDQGVLGGRDAAAQPLEALQQRQLLWCGQRLAVKLEHPIERGVQPVKSRRQRLPIDTTASHNPKLSEGTDKKRHPETTETKVTQEVYNLSRTFAKPISGRQRPVHDESVRGIGMVQRTRVASRWRGWHSGVGHDRAVRAPRS